MPTKSLILKCNFTNHSVYRQKNDSDKHLDNRPSCLCVRQDRCVPLTPQPLISNSAYAPAPQLTDRLFQGIATQSGTAEIKTKRQPGYFRTIQRFTGRSLEEAGKKRIKEPVTTRFADRQPVSDRARACICVCSQSYEVLLQFAAFLLCKEAFTLTTPCLLTA